MHMLVDLVSRSPPGFWHSKSDFPILSPNQLDRRIKIQALAIANGCFIETDTTTTTSEAALTSGLDSCSY